jgi:hypothetical protein
MMGLGVAGGNISEKYKFQWIAPERTGSRKVAEVLSYYDFNHLGDKIYNYGRYNYSHKTIVNENLWKVIYPSLQYKTICNARNPYGRTYSLFKNFYSQIRDKSKEGFRRYLTEDLPRGQTMSMVVEPKWDKPFDYVIRLEHMKDDLMKLPFILDVLTESQVEMMSSHGKEIENWEEFYDDEMKEIVYNLTEHHFNLWGYKK